MSANQRGRKREYKKYLRDEAEDIPRTSQVYHDKEKVTVQRLGDDCVGNVVQDVEDLPLNNFEHQNEERDTVCNAELQQRNCLSNLDHHCHPDPLVRNVPEIFRGELECHTQDNENEVSYGFFESSAQQQASDEDEDVDIHLYLADNAADNGNINSDEEEDGQNFNLNQNNHDHHGGREDSEGANDSSSVASLEGQEDSAPALLVRNVPEIFRGELECHTQDNENEVSYGFFESSAQQQASDEDEDVDIHLYLADNAADNGNINSDEEEDGQNFNLNQNNHDHHGGREDSEGDSDSSVASLEDQEDSVNIPPHRSHTKLRRDIETQEFTSPITTAVNASPAEALLMTLTMHQQNNSSFKAFVDSTKLVNSLFVSPVIPKSAYLLDKVLQSEEGIVRNFFCKECSYYFGEKNHKETPSIVCPGQNCGAVNKIHDLTKASFFALYPLPMQIELLLKNKNIREKLMKPKDLVEIQQPNVMTDLHGGQCYRKFVLSLRDSDNCVVISFTVCTDGSPLFKSSNFSIWPFFVSINELPGDIRMKNLLLGGLFFGNKKPHMDLYLKPIVEHLSSLSRGFTIDVGEADQVEELQVKAYTLACCVDSGARGDVQGINTHSGYFSCNWCEIPGEWLGKVVFPFPQDPPKRRSHEDVVQYARECAEDKRNAYVYGVKYLSCLASLPQFDIVNGMVLDYAHNIPFGISRTFLEEWLSNTGRGCYIGAPSDIEELDKKMMQLTPPIEVRRAVRKISDRAHWNAREFENYTRFYSVLVLEEILPLKYLTSWCHLVQGLFLLSRTSVTHQDINNARKILLHFEKDSEALYGTRFCTYNLHICGQHLAENAARWGPVHAINTFCFEAGIKVLKGLLHAQRGVPHQIHRAICYRQAHQILTHACATPKTEAFAADIVAKPNKGTTYFPYPECVAIGPSTSFKPKDDERFLLENSEFQIDAPNCDVFHKIILGKCVYTTETFASGKKFNNSCALTNDGKIVLLKKFVVDRTSQKVYVFFVEALCRVFLKMPQNVRILPSDHCLRIVHSFAGRLELKSVRCLKIVCFFSKMNGKMYAGEFPNILNTF